MLICLCVRSTERHGISRRPAVSNGGAQASNATRAIAELLAHRPVYTLWGRLLAMLWDVQGVVRYPIQPRTHTACKGLMRSILPIYNFRIRPIADGVPASHFKCLILTVY